MRAHLAGSSAFVVLALVGCQKPTAGVAVDASPATPSPTVLAAVAAKTAPSPAPPTPAPELAPPGRYFLRAKASVQTDAGIVGYPPGAALTRIARGQYRAADGNKLTIADTTVTNNLVEVRRLLSSDAAQQAAHAKSVGPATAIAPVKTTKLAPSSHTLTRAADRTTQDLPFVDGVETQRSGLQTSTNLGATHTKTAEGVLWQKSPDGTQWIPVKYLRGKVSMSLPPPHPVR